MKPHSFFFVGFLSLSFFFHSYFFPHGKRGTDFKVLRKLGLCPSRSTLGFKVLSHLSPRLKFGPLTFLVRFGTSRFFAPFPALLSDSKSLYISPSMWFSCIIYFILLQVITKGVLFVLVWQICDIFYLSSPSGEIWLLFAFLSLLLFVLGNGYFIILTKFWFYSFTEKCCFVTLLTFNLICIPFVLGIALYFFLIVYEASGPKHVDSTSVAVVISALLSFIEMLLSSGIMFLRSELSTQMHQFFYRFLFFTDEAHNRYFPRDVWTFRLTFILFEFLFVCFGVLLALSFVFFPTFPSVSSTQIDWRWMLYPYVFCWRYCFGWIGLVCCVLFNALRQFQFQDQSLLAFFIHLFYKLSWFILVVLSFKGPSFHLPIICVILFMCNPCLSFFSTCVIKLFTCRQACQNMITY